MYALKIALVVLFSGFMAQFIKILSYYLEHRRLNFKRVFETGGMPSSHASTAMTITVLVGLHNGFNTLLFAVVLYFAGVIMYDAAGLRRAAGKQAAILNKLVDEYSKTKHIDAEKLVEFLGHTPFEVIIGALLGIVIALIFA